MVEFECKRLHGELLAHSLQSAPGGALGHSPVQAHAQPKSILFCSTAMAVRTMRGRGTALSR